MDHIIWKQCHIKVYKMYHLYTRSNGLVGVYANDTKNPDRWWFLYNFAFVIDKYLKLMVLLATYPPDGAFFSTVYVWFCTLKCFYLFKMYSGFFHIISCWCNFLCLHMFPGATLGIFIPICMFGHLTTPTHLKKNSFYGSEICRKIMLFTSPNTLCEMGQLFNKLPYFKVYKAKVII